MDLRIVRAKLHQPTISFHPIPRSHLVQILNNGLAGKVTLVSAPAGFGKSTVVSLWLDQLGAESPTTKTSWLSLEEADDHLPRFVQYFVAAVEKHYPRSCEAVLTLLYETEPATIEALVDELVDALTNAFAQSPGQHVIVLDDLHLVNDDTIYTFLSRLIRHTTNQLHLVLITRVDPPLPLNRWRAQGQLNELRIHALGFTLAETTAYLSEQLGEMPSLAMVEILHARTEGWAVGLRLVALALQSTSDYEALVAGFEANSNRYIIDYLVDDVLDHLPPPLQQFLSGAAILERFCPALCAAVLEIDETTARQRIAEMARANLFLIELSSPAYWYRFHHQFQSMLLSRLHERYDQQAVAALHRRAASWLAAHHEVEDAIHHLMAVSDFDAAADLIESHLVEALNDQRFHELETWLDMLPVQLLNQRPVLLVGLAWVQNYWLNDAESLATMKRAEALLREQAATLPITTRKVLQAETAALYMMQARRREREVAVSSIRHHWMQIREYLAFTHWDTIAMLSHHAYFLGEAELALGILLTAIEQATEWSPMPRSRLHYSLGILYWYDCNLVQAERAFRESLRLARQHSLSLAVTLALFGMALVTSGRNQQEQAEAYQLEVIREPHYQNGLRAVLCAYDLMMVYAARGEPEAGRILVEQLKAHAVLVGRPYLLNQVEALEAFLALLCGDLAAAWHWARASSRSEMYRAEDRVPLIRVQILMAEGSSASLQEAGHVLQGLSHRHESQFRWSLWIETLILESLNWAKLARMDLALPLLDKAVARAVLNGMIGPFVRYGTAVERLLRALGPQSPYSQQVELLLSAFPAAQGNAGQGEATSKEIRIAASADLVEPLSDREQEVLALLVGRLSNKEIAQRLIISPHTVRNHTANIFGKLQVENRIQAVERARLLGLLPPEE